MSTIRLRTPAKINIYLSVLNRRADNYHELETLFQAIELYDELVIRKKKGKSKLFVRNSPELQGDDNLIYKALKWVENRCEVRLEVEIELDKQIPVAAGLGGGSSDAAATILGLRELFNLSELSDEIISQGALSLGADVPFFLTGGAAIGEGIGERLTPFNLKCDYNILLVNPGFLVSTAEIFSAYSRTLTVNKKKGTLRGLLDRGVALSELLHNDLQQVAETMYPEIGSIRETFVHKGMTDVLMTGSGPTVFALGESDELKAVMGSFDQKYRVLLIRPSSRGVLID